MVLEGLITGKTLEKKSRLAFFVGALYSFLGIFLAKILFPQDPALVAVAFTSILLLPSLYKMFTREEKMEEKEKHFSFKELYKDNKQFIKIYIFLFLGILVVYSFSAMILGSFQVNELFREQLEMRGAGGAVFHEGLFEGLLSNNFEVLIAIFLISLVTGDGAIFLIVWNASVWGTIFGITARNAGAVSDTHPLVYFALIMLIVFPHMILEALAYILGAISGGMISKDVLMERFESRRFNEVFFFNFILFIVALVVLVLGAIVETYVLSNVDTYIEIIRLSFRA